MDVLTPTKFGGYSKTKKYFYFEKKTVKIWNFSLKSVMHIEFERDDAMMAVLANTT